MVDLRKLSIPIVAGFSLAIGSCGGDNLTLPSAGEPAHIEILDANTLQAPVSSELALVVRVTDSQNRPVEGATVQFVLHESTGGGSVNPGSGVTDTAGLAGTTLILGTRVGQLTGQAQVAVDEGDAPVATEFVATALSADANVISMVSGDGQKGPIASTLGAPLVVRVTDAFGNPIPSATVNWSVTGGGEVSAASTQTDAAGQTSVQRTLGSTAGEQTTVARADGLAGSPVTFIHTATAGSAARVTIISGDGQQALPGSQLPNPLVVQVLDAENNPIVDIAVAWVVGTGDGSASPETSRTNAQGEASTRWTLGPVVGRNTLTAVVSGVGTALFNATATKVPSSISITSHLPDPSTVGQPVEVRVEVTGSGATPSGTVTVTGEGGGSCEVTLAGGNGTCSLAFGTPGNHRITATYNGDSRFNGSTDNENHRVQPANTPPTAAFSPPSCTAGESCAFIDSSSDTDGNVVAWSWEFGDGGSAVDRNPTHIYAAEGTYSVKLTVRDNHGASAEVIHQVTVSAPAPVNFPPVATDDTYETSAGGSFHAPGEGMNSLLANDADLNGDALSVAAGTVTTSLGGTAILAADGSFDYTAPPTTGTDVFDYTVTDGKGGSDTGTVTITLR